MPPPIEPNSTSGAIPPENDINRPTVTKDDHDAFEKGLDEAIEATGGEEGGGEEEVVETPKKEPAKAAPAPKKEAAKAPVKPEAPAKPAAAAPKADKPLAGAKTEPAKPATVKAAEEKPKEEEPAKPKEEEIDEIPEPKGLSPENIKNFKALREVAKAERVKNKELNKKYEEAVTAAATLEKQVGKVPPEVEQRLKRADEIIRTFDIQNDPKFLEQFDSKVKQNNEDVYGLLEKYGLPKDKLDEFKKGGGIESVPLSWWYSVTTKDADGKEVKGPGWLTMLQQSNDPNANAAAVVIENKLKANAQIQYDKDQEIKKAAEGKSQYQIERQKAAEKQATEDNAYYQKRIVEIQESIPWAKEQPIPEDATPEEKARLEADNKFFKDTEERLKVALHPRNVADRVETAFAACLSFRLMDELDLEKAKVAQLVEEVTRLKGARRAPKDGGAPIVPKEKLAMANRSNLSDSEAIDAGLQEAEASVR